jgi:hypothetical protein
MKKVRNFLNRRAVRVVVAAMLASALAPAAYATGGDTTFDGISAVLSGWLSGSLGILMGLAGLGVSIFSLIRQQWGGVAVGFAVALLGTTGPAIITGIFPAII